MDLAKQYQAVIARQLSYQEGLDLLTQIQREHAGTRATANAWGATAVIANAALIPLNAIINSMELKGANTLYQATVRAVYSHFAKSGTRSSGPAKVALASLKKAVLDELKRRAATDYVPGVNILVGLAEADWLALLQVSMQVDSGSREMADQARSLERKISELQRKMRALGVQRSELLDAAQRRGNIA